MESNSGEYAGAPLNNDFEPKRNYKLSQDTGRHIASEGKETGQLSHDSLGKDRTGEVQAKHEIAQVGMATDSGEAMKYAPARKSDGNM